MCSEEFRKNLGDTVQLKTLVKTLLGNDKAFEAFRRYLLQADVSSIIFQEYPLIWHDLLPNRDGDPKDVPHFKWSRCGS